VILPEEGETRNVVTFKTDCDDAPLFYSLIRPHDFIIKIIFLPFTSKQGREKEHTILQQLQQAASVPCILASNSSKKISADLLLLTTCITILICFLFFFTQIKI